MKTADEYADEAVDYSSVAPKDDPIVAAFWIGQAQVRATLALAAATLEAARLMGPTPEDQARLDALDLACPAETERDLYRHENAEAGDAHDCVRYAGHSGRHRCRVCAYEWPAA